MRACRLHLPLKVPNLAWCWRSEPLLCVGFRHGGITLFTQHGVVLVSFLLAASPVLRIRECPDESMKQAEHQSKISERLMMLHEHGLLILLCLDSLTGLTEAPDGTIQSEDLWLSL
ncbi:unnamed protein product [Durusdinium trenchii]|uniref:Uncharacterized protein n=2 Tax=Durusdinium trenchii TaxID=1381693 RepID=A0ABP0MLJ2_9DINO